MMDSQLPLDGFCVAVAVESCCAANRPRCQSSCDQVSTESLVSQEDQPEFMTKWVSANDFVSGERAERPAVVSKNQVQLKS